MGPPLTQLSPPTPTFVEKDIADQTGPVFIVTGSTSGIGYELAKMIYSRNGTVYIASRSSSKILEAIDTIQCNTRSKTGQLVALKLDLADLSSIKASANEFFSKESRLDVIFHNAGLMTPPPDSKTSLEDLHQTAATARQARVIWLSSMISASVPTGGIVMAKDGTPAVLKNKMENCMQSKVGNVYLAIETAHRISADGIISVSVNPGLLKTELQRHMPAGLIFKELKHGAYSELYAGFSPEIKKTNNGAFIIPWGRIGPIPDHILEGIKSGKAARFYDWCDRTTKPYQ